MQCDHDGREFVLQKLHVAEIADVAVDEHEDREEAIVEVLEALDEHLRLGAYRVAAARFVEARVAIRNIKVDRLTLAPIACHDTGGRLVAGVHGPEYEKERHQDLQVEYAELEHVAVPFERQIEYQISTRSGLRRNATEKSGLLTE